MIEFVPLNQKQDYILLFSIIVRLINREIFSKGIDYLYYYEMEVCLKKRDNITGRTYNESPEGNSNNWI